VQLDAGALTGALTAEALTRWLAAEAEADARSDAWSPGHGPAVSSIDAQELLRGGLLFALPTAAARARLLREALRFLGVRWSDAAPLLDGTALEPLLAREGTPPRGVTALWAAGTGGRAAFRERALAQSAAARPDCTQLCAAALRGCSAPAALAKQLLGERREDAALWAAFAQSEAAGGRVGAARRAFAGALVLARASALRLIDTAAGTGAGGPLCALLAAACGPASAAADAPAVMLAYARFEAAQGSVDRAACLLTALGEGSFAAPAAEGGPAASAMRAARLGFQSALGLLCTPQLCASALAHADAPGVAVAVAASELERLRGGGGRAASALLLRFAAAAQEGGGAAEAVEALCCEGVRAACAEGEGPAPCRGGVAAALREAFRVTPGSVQLMALLLALPPSLRPQRFHLPALLSGGGEEAPEIAAAALATELLLCPAPQLASFRAAALLTRALAGQALSRSPLAWRCRVGAAWARADGAACRRAYFRSMAAVPGNKALWLEALEALNGAGGVSDAERGALLEAARGAGAVALRTDVFQIALDMQAERVLV